MWDFIHVTLQLLTHFTRLLTLPLTSSNDFLIPIMIMKYQKRIVLYYKIQIKLYFLKMILTFFLHIYLQAFFKPTRLALIPSCNVDNAITTFFAHVIKIPKMQKYIWKFQNWPKDLKDCSNIAKENEDYEQIGFVHTCHCQAWNDYWMIGWANKNMSIA